MSRKPQLLVLNEYYWPGLEATAFLLTELCEALAPDFEVTVITGALYGVDAQPGSVVRNGVRIVRVVGTAYERSKLPLRALNYATYLGASLWQGLQLKKPDIVMCWTDPPVIADIGLILARRAGVPLLVITQDVFPEIAEQLGRLESPALVRLLRVLVNAYLHRADRVVAIGETMARRLEDKGVGRDRLEVIQNWVDTKTLVPSERENAWARKHGLEGKFVVMHSGNVGYAQNLELLVRAATFLRDLDDLAVVIVGGGARSSEIGSFIERLEPDNVRLLPYQPRDALPLSLGSAHVHYVGLTPRLAGFVVPSRVYGVLAVGRPVLVAADAESETARIVEEAGCGLVVRPDRADQLAAAIRRMHAREVDLDEMGRRAREWVLASADRDVAIARYREVLWSLARTR